MKTVFSILALFTAVSLPAFEARMRVVDDIGNPIEGANVVIEFVGALQAQSESHRGKSNRDGYFSVRGESKLEVYMEAKKTGHYDARVDGLSPRRDLDELIVLPRILNPIPLFAWDIRVGRSAAVLHFPRQDEWLGFDLQAGDWVRPQGKGIATDIRFRFRNGFKEWRFSETAMANNRRVNRGASEDEIRSTFGKWDAELDISFPGEKEGLFEETRFLAYSQLKLPHAAPAEGYGPTWHYTANNYSPRTAREKVGFFLRTRVKLDKEGKIISANYAKVVGDFYLVPQGSLLFAYYFNPVPNDRNLEFDPKKNLFPANFPGANVNEP